MNNNYQTSDIAISAYLMMKGFKLLSAGKSSSGKYNFLFDDPNNTAEKVALEYLNSDFSKFDNYLRNLKKVIYKN